MKQNLELRAGLRASERRRLEAKPELSGLGARGARSEARVPGPLVWLAQSITHRAACLVLGDCGTSREVETGGLALLWVSPRPMSRRAHGGPVRLSAKTSTTKQKHLDAARVYGAICAFCPY